MREFQNIKISDFTYRLPEGRIAKYPLKERDSSKLLFWQNGKTEQTVFRNIASYLPENSLLVFNNTRVIHARLFFRKKTGAKIEIFCLEPVSPADYQIAFQEKEKVTWKCMVGNSKKWKSGELHREFEMEGKTVVLKAGKTEQKGNSFTIEFNWNGGFTFAEIIEHAGVLPIPPYLNRETEPEDELTYQTVYAKNDGSVAAPTAGLHFTQSVLKNLAEKNIETAEITLHVGAGTFQPVKSETIDGHTMHHEQVLISKSFIEKLLAPAGKIIAVGTTSVRSLESLYWLGLKLEKENHPGDIPEVLQWEPYENEATINIEKALQNILDFLEKTRQEMVRFSTQIIIVPGYEFKIIEGMVTNFHQPQSTLLLLISAFLGSDWKKVYDFALNNDFRFLSYGDSNLYLR
ncbi:MAG: S-adenosylmethionine:tRNA ribosyltransferase-isomerase [Bacteroidota bacterium]